MTETMENGIVFVVDDDPHVLASVEALLRSRNIQVRCFSSGSEFFESTDVQQVGCVISDLRMPEMNGTELQKKLIASDSPLSLIIVTGFADVPSTVKLMQNGAVTLLEKPYDTESLFDAIEKALKQSRQTLHRKREEQDAKARIDLLDEEELLVMTYAIQGLPMKAIGERLTLSNRTVDRRRQTALTKARVANVSEFAILLEKSRPKD